MFLLCSNVMGNGGDAYTVSELLGEGRFYFFIYLGVFFLFVTSLSPPTLLNPNLLAPPIFSSTSLLKEGLSGVQTTLT